MQGPKVGRLWVLVVASIPPGLLAVITSSCASAHSQGETLAPGSQYVAMGTSYAAGLHVDLDDVSCGGAVTANTLDTPQDSAPHKSTRSPQRLVW
jgi:hypothetical protein